MSNSFLSNNNQNTSKSFIGQYEGIQDQNGLIIEENYLDVKPTNNINIKKRPNYVTGSYIDNDGCYTVGDDVYEAETIRSFSNFDESNYTVSVIEQKCPKCNVWLTHYCYGKYQCSNCGFIDIYREDPLNN